jgi:prenyltransferase beta subunit
MRRLLTASALMLIAVSSAGAQTSEQRSAAVAYLRSLQTTEGGFMPATPDKDNGYKRQPTLRATSGAIRALKYFGGKAKNPEAAARFVQSCFDKATGGFADVPEGKPDVTSTAVGLMAVVELQPNADAFAPAALAYLGKNARSFEEIRIAAAGLEAVGKEVPEAKAWLATVAKAANPDGTFGKGAGQARDTGSSVVVVLRLGGKSKSWEGVLKAMRAGQRDDGGFGKAEVGTSDLETCYRVMRAFHMLKERPADSEKLRTFISKCRNPDGGYGVEPGKTSAIGSTYYAAILLHWLDEK